MNQFQMKKIFFLNVAGKLLMTL